MSRMNIDIKLNTYLFQTLCFSDRIFLVYICLVGVAIVQSSSPTSICQHHLDNDRIQDYSNCSKYIECEYQGPTYHSCSDGQKFDPNLRVCTANPVSCFSCPADDIFVDYPVDYECSQFVRCINGVASHHSCFEGHLFDPIERQCKHRKSVECSCPRIDFRGFPFIVRDWTDFAKFVYVK